MADREFTNINGIKVCDQTARDNIPTNVSELTNDAHYASQTYVNNKISEAQLGGDGGTVDLSGYVTKETGNANQITFADGQTFQAKLDAGTLKGDKGDTGANGQTGQDGQTPNITIGTVTTLAAGTNATAEIIGTTPNLSLNLGIPKGDKGDKGDTGTSGSGGTASSTDIKPLINSTSNVQKSQYNAKPIRPLISFTDDDGKAGVYTKWLPILQEKNIPLNLCIITNMVGKPGYLTWSQIQELQDTYECEVLSHTVTHANIATHETNKSWIEELKQSKQTLIEHGLNVRGFAYPNGGDWGTREGLVDGTTKAHWMTGLFYDYGITTGSTINTHPITSNMGIDRAGIGSYAAEGRFDTLDNIKARVDECYDQNGWLIFMTHVDDTGHTDEDNQMLRDLIDYINTKGIDIVTLSEGFEIFGNAIETPSCKITKQGETSLEVTATVPNATKNTAGIVKVGDGISVADGVISVDGSLYYTKEYLDSYIDDFETRISSLEAGGGGGSSHSNPIISSIANITASPGKSFDIVYTATDSDGIQSHELSMDNGVEYNVITPVQGENDQYTYSTSIADEGTYYYKLKVTDTLGNIAIRSFSITIKSTNIYLPYVTEGNADTSEAAQGIFTITNTADKYDVVFLYDNQNKLELNQTYTLSYTVLENTLSNPSALQISTTWDVVHNVSLFSSLESTSIGETKEIPFTVYKIPNSKGNNLISLQLDTTEGLSGSIKFKVFVKA